MHRHPLMTRSWRCMLRAALGCALSHGGAGCVDGATVGALCPAGCEFREQEQDCDCTSASAAGGAGDCTTGLCMMDAGTSDASIGAGGDAACLPGTYPLRAQQPTLVVALDDGSSLLPWWPALSEGFLRFIQEDASRGMQVGLMPFAEACDAQSYLPALVPIAPLPDNLSELQAAVPSTTSLSTSTVPVFSAALQYATQWASAHPDTRVSVLLISDASPGACDGFIDDYVGEATRLAREAYTGSPSIATYAVGGDGLDTIRTIAMAGGTQATLISTLSTSDAVLAALHELRDAPTWCALALPDGVTLAADSQVIWNMPGGTQRAFDIARSSSACQNDGFYVEEPASAYPLLACPETCAALSAAGSAAGSLSLSAACGPTP